MSVLSFATVIFVGTLFKDDKSTVTLDNDCVPVLVRVKVVPLRLAVFK